jgi:hypothetical protein
MMNVLIVTAVLLLPPVSTQLPAQPSPGIRQSLSNLSPALDAAVLKSQTNVQAPAKRKRSIGRQIAGGVLGTAAGLFAGAYLGAAIDGECGCDDPGLRGAILGAPIGAIVGGILGAKFF